MRVKNAQNFVLALTIIVLGISCVYYVINGDISSEQTCVVSDIINEDYWSCEFTNCECRILQEPVHCSNYNSTVYGVCNRNVECSIGFETGTRQCNVRCGMRPKEKIIFSMKEVSAPYYPIFATKRKEVGTFFHINSLEKYTLGEIKKCWYYLSTKEVRWNRPLNLIEIISRIFTVLLFGLTFIMYIAANSS